MARTLGRFRLSHNGSELDDALTGSDELAPLGLAELLHLGARQEKEPFRDGDAGGLLSVLRQENLLV
jgi:hypothetical protein